MLAVSMAADELTPLPSGTVEATTILAPDVSGIPRSRASTRKTPTTYAAQCGATAASPSANIRARPVVGDRHTAGASAASGIVTGGRPRLTTSSTGRSSRCTAAHVRFGDRALQHERTGVVGDAAHHVEPSRRPRDRPSRAPGSNSRRARSVSTNASRSSASAPSGLRRVASDPSARAQLLLEQRLDLRADPRVRVTHPRHVGVHGQRRVERLTAGVSHDHAALLGDERAADVVRMARERRRQASFARARGPISGRRSAMKRSWPAASSYSCPPVEAY